MRLQGVTLFGFKSFADRTDVRILPGITAIVGPNGCGKSNISDALRWALGEQSPKALRGHRMEDVIFHGSASRRPLGLSEVLLTFSNDGELSVPWSEVGRRPAALPRRRVRVPPQQDGLPAEGHPRPLPGHGREPEGLRAHGAGAPGPHPHGEAARPADLRGGGGRHHPVQAPAGRDARQAGGDPPEPPPRAGRDGRGQAAARPPSSARRRRRSSTRRSRPSGGRSRWPSWRRSTPTLTGEEERLGVEEAAERARVEVGQTRVAALGAALELARADVMTAEQRAAEARHTLQRAELELEGCVGRAEQLRLVERDLGAEVDRLGEEAEALSLRLKTLAEERRAKGTLLEAIRREFAAPPGRGRRPRRRRSTSCACACGARREAAEALRHDQVGLAGHRTELGQILGALDERQEHLHRRLDRLKAERVEADAERARIEAARGAASARVGAAAARVAALEVELRDLATDAGAAAAERAAATEAAETCRVTLASRRSSRAALEELEAQRAGLRAGCAGGLRGRRRGAPRRRRGHGRRPPRGAPGARARRRGGAGRAAPVGGDGDVRGRQDGPRLPRPLRRRAGDLPAARLAQRQPARPTSARIRAWWGWRRRSSPRAILASSPTCSAPSSWCAISARPSACTPRTATARAS